MSNTNKKFVSGKEASKILGVHQRTLYNWEDQKIIETIRTPGGKRMYNVEKYLASKGMTINKNKVDKHKYCYCRVSSTGQGDDLKRQIKYMQEKYPDYEIVKDIGSGLNFNRKGLQKIIDEAIDGKIDEVVIAYKDRLARFGYELIEHIITKYSNGKITIVNEMDLDPEEELTKDLVQIMNVFTARMNGLRKYKKKQLNNQK